MTSLEHRLRSLRDPATDVPPPEGLRRRAQWRQARRRRRRVAAVVALPFLILGAVAVRTLQEEPEEQLVSGPSTSTASTTFHGGSTPVQALGDVRGVEVTVSPQTDLVDGALLSVRITGLEELPGAQILQCAGDVTAENAVSSCTANSVQRPDAESVTPVIAAERQVVSVARTIHITRGSDDGNEPLPFDCAVEDAGCVLAIGPYELPARAVLVPIVFRDEPRRTPVVELTPSSGLIDGQDVSLTAADLRPNTQLGIRLCQSEDFICDELHYPSATTDDRGSLRTTVTVRTAIYGYGGRVNCAATPCAVVIADADGERIAQTPFAFAPGAVAPVPQLRIEPPGPHVDRQIVTVHGTGFPPGFDLASHLGICPADKDTAQEERCGYPSAIEPVIVDDAGNFTTSLQLYDTLTFTGSCAAAPGCLLAWVLVKGPIAASVSLEFIP